MNVPGAEAKECKVIAPCLPSTETEFYDSLAAFLPDFDNNASAIVWLAHANYTPYRKLTVPPQCRKPKSYMGRTGYAIAFLSFGLSLRELDTKSGHWHYWFFPAARIDAFRHLQSALLRRCKESPHYDPAVAKQMHLPLKRTPTIMQPSLPIPFAFPIVKRKVAESKAQNEEENTTAKKPKTTGSVQCACFSSVSSSPSPAVSSPLPTPLSVSSPPPLPVLLPPFIMPWWLMMMPYQHSYY